MRRAEFIRRAAGFAAGGCLIATVLGGQAGWPWSALAGLMVLTGVCLAVVFGSDPMPETRDPTARAAQPGFTDGTPDGGGGGSDAG